MERIRNLNNCQKAIVVIVLFMAVFFAIMYAVIISRVGFLYQEHILVPHTQNGNTVYSGSIRGTDCSFTITSDKVVSFHCGPKFYGPYTATEDSTAIPEEYTLSPNCVGIELRETVNYFSGVPC